MKDEDVLCTIKWTVADVKSAFREEHCREPTDEELEECVNMVDVSALEDSSIEHGWYFINKAVI